MEDCNQALEGKEFFNPASAYLQRAFIYCALGDYKEAIRDCNNSAENAPVDSQPYALLNLAQRMSNWQNGSVNGFESREKAVLKQFMQTDYNSAWVRLTNCTPENAAQELDLTKMKADILSVMRKDEEAKVYYQILVQKLPDDFTLFRQLALTQYQLREGLQALQRTKELLSANPNNDVLVKLADLLSPKPGKCGVIRFRPMPLLKSK